MCSWTTRGILVCWVPKSGVGEFVLRRMMLVKFETSGISAVKGQSIQGKEVRKSREIVPANWIAATNCLKEGGSLQRVKLLGDLITMVRWANRGRNGDIWVERRDRSADEIMSTAARLVVYLSGIRPIEIVYWPLRNVRLCASWSRCRKSVLGIPGYEHRDLRW